MPKLTNKKKLNDWLELYPRNCNACLGNFLMQENCQKDWHGCWHRYLQPYFPKDSVSWLLSWMVPWGVPCLDIKGTNFFFWNLGLQVAGKCIFLDFSWNLKRVSWGSFEEKLTRKIHTAFIYVCLKVSKPKTKKNRHTEWRIFQVCFKKSKKN